ncbi:MAG: hypothetical protein IIC90_05125 [Chloroflexi bacterium]|nr:hypothetical protein [Chloroflexota bacterium]
MGSSWRMNAKWLFGLLCLAAIIVAAVLYSASKPTERDVSTSIFSSILISLAKDDEGAEAFEEYQALAVANPDEDFTIEGITLPIKGRELIGLSYDEAVELVIGRIAEILYTDGPDAVEQFFNDTSVAGSEESAAGEGEEFNLGPFAILTQDTHDLIRRIFTFSLIPVLVLAALLVFFSRRFGRLGSPGVVLAVGAAPFALLWLIAKGATNNAGQDGVEGALAEALAPMAGELSTTFLWLLALGVALVLASVAGHIGFALWHRSRPTPTRGQEETPPPDEPEQPNSLADEGATASGGDEFPSIGPRGVPQA